MPLSFLVAFFSNLPSVYCLHICLWARSPNIVPRLFPSPLHPCISPCRFPPLPLPPNFVSRTTLLPPQSPNPSVSVHLPYQLHNIVPSVTQEYVYLHPLSGHLAAVAIFLIMLLILFGYVQHFFLPLTHSKHPSLPHL